MRKVQIKFSAISDIRAFVNTIGKYSADAKLKSGSYTVNARSLMGIFALDLMKPIDLIVRGNDSVKLLDKVSQYIVCEQ